MTDSTLPPASFSTAASWNGLSTHIVVSPTCNLYDPGTIVTEATTAGVEVVSLLLHAAKIAAAATSPTSRFLMHCSIPLWCRAPVVPPAGNTSLGSDAPVHRKLPQPRYCRLRNSRLARMRACRC